MQTVKSQKKQLEDNKLIQVWFKKDMAERVELAASERGQSVSEFIRQASLISLKANCTLPLHAS